MKTIKLICFLPMVVFCTNQSVEAQTLAFSENGDTVVLYNNGTWDYISNVLKTDFNESEITVNPTKFRKPKSAREKAGGGKGMYEIWFDPSEWKRIPPGEINDEADNAFELLDDDAYAAVIFERMEIPMESLLEIALDNARDVAPDARIVSREWREVNGHQVLCARIEGTLTGIRFTYFSYYFSNNDGTIQFTSFTGQDLFKELKPKMEDLLNGLIVVE